MVSIDHIHSVIKGAKQTSSMISGKGKSTFQMFDVLNKDYYDQIIDFNMVKKN